MLDTVTRHAQAARDSTVLRDEWIRAAWQDGWSYRTIGQAAGLSHTAIKNIVEKGADN